LHPGGLWRAEAFAVPIASHVTFDPNPDVAPLLELLDEYERYAVAVVDKEKARLLTVFAGEVEDSELFRDFVFGKTDQGGLSQPDYQRHHETHVHWHLEKVVRRLADLHRRRRFDRLILAGPSEATAELRRLLPATLERRVVAMIGTELFASDHEILARTLDIERLVERRAEERLLDEIIDLAGPAGRPTLGLEPTLAALWSASVRTLAVSADLRVTGSECPTVIDSIGGESSTVQPAARRCAPCTTSLIARWRVLRRSRREWTSFAGRPGIA
jgi:peptide subunit release factor 1 (eRF1)